MINFNSIQGKKSKKIKIYFSEKSNASIGNFQNYLGGGEGDKATKRAHAYKPLASSPREAIPLRSLATSHFSLRYSLNKL